MDYHNIGLNMITIGSIGAFLFGLGSLWALFQQGYNIWANKSAESVSLLYFSYSFFISVIFIIYGLSISSILAVLTNFFFSAFNIFIVLGIIKYRGLSGKEMACSLIYLILIGIMIISPEKGKLLTLFCIGGYISLLSQIVEVVRNKSIGQLEIRLFIIYWVSTSFWIVYSYGLGNNTLLALCCANISLITIMIFTLIYYSHKALKANI